MNGNEMGPSPGSQVLLVSISAGRGLAWRFA